MMKRLLALALSALLLLTAACADVLPEDSRPAADSGGALSPDTREPSPKEPGLAEALPPAAEISAPESAPSPEDGKSAGQAGGAAGIPESGLPTETPEAAGAAEGGREIDPEKPMVALTYDDGPHAVYTDQILDILEAYQARATFFEVGRSLYNDADAVRRAAAMGCEVGSHSYRHADLSKLSQEAILSDLDRADANFEDVLGCRPNLLRPPYGSVSRTLRGVTGRSLIAWSIDTQDWLSRDAEKIMDTVRSAGDLDGQVILMHSTYDTSVEASRVLIPWLIEQGYQLVTVTELITLHYGDTLQANGLYNYEYFHFGRPVSLPAAGTVPAPPPADPPPEDPPPETPPEQPSETLPEQGQPPEQEQPPEGTPEGTPEEEPPPEQGGAAPPEETEALSEPENAASDEPQDGGI